MLLLKIFIPVLRMFYKKDKISYFPGMFENPAPLQIPLINLDNCML